MPTQEASPSARNASPQRRSDQVKVGLITAASTLGAAIITVAIPIAAQLIEVRQTVTEPSSTELSDELEALQSRVQDIEERNGDLVAENEALSHQIETAPLPTDEDQATAVPSSVFRQTAGAAVSIASGSCISLDTQARNWEVTTEASIGSGIGLCFYEGEISVDHATIMESEPTYEECADRTYFDGDEVDAGSMRSGLHVCAESREGRQVYLRVAEATKDRASLHIRIWNAK